MAGPRAGDERTVPAHAVANGRYRPDGAPDRLVALHRVSTLVAQQRRPEDVLREALQSAVSLIGGDAGAIHRWGPDARVLRRVVGYGRYETATRAELQPGEGLTGRAFVEQASAIENEYATSAVATPNSLKAGLRAGIAVPISHGGTCLGILSVGSSDPKRAFDAEDAQ